MESPHAQRFPVLSSQTAAHAENGMAVTKVNSRPVETGRWSLFPLLY